MKKHYTTGVAIVFGLALMTTGMVSLKAQKVNEANLNHKFSITKNQKTQSLKSFSVKPLSAPLPGSTDAIIEDNAFLQGKFVEVGISQCGCFGTTVEQPAGYHGNINNMLGFVADPAKDGWDVGNPAYNGDYFLPGSPEEGWGIEIDGTNYGNFSQCEDNSVPGKVTSINYKDSIHYATWEGIVQGLKIKQVVSFKDEGTYFLISATITNNSGSTAKNLFYMRNVDPDNENVSTGSYSTINRIQAQPTDNACKRALVSGTGLTYGMYLGLGTADERARVTWGGFSNRNASEVWNGTGDFSQSGESENDIAISLAFKIGDLPAGESTTVIYAYVLDSTQIDAAMAAVVRLRANNEDITNTLIHTNCDEPVDLFVSSTTGLTWTWSPKTYLDVDTGSHVIFNAPKGKYSASVSGTSACKTVNYDFTIVIGSDTAKPVVVIKPQLMASLNKNDSAIIKVSDIDQGSYDDCKIDTMYVTPSLLLKTALGKITNVEFTMKDKVGNVSKGTCQVTLISFIQDSILKQIIDYNKNGNASDLADTMLIQLGITGENPDNLGAYKNAIENASAIEDIFTVQTIVDQTNAIVIIGNMSDNNNASELTIDLLTKAGISSPLAENLKYYKEVLEEGWTSSLSNLKYVITEGNILGKINQMAVNDDASKLTIDMFYNIELYDVNSDYIDDYKSAVEAKSSIPSKKSLDELILSVNAFKEIVNMAENDNASGLDTSLLATAGVKNAKEYNLSIYQDSVAAQTTFTNVAEIQALIDKINSANTAFKLIVAMAVNDDASNLTGEMLKEVGVTVIIDKYFTEYQDSIVAADTFETEKQIADLINAINATSAFKEIQQMAIDADASSLFIDLLAAAYVTNARESFLDAYKDTIANAGTIASVEALQQMISDVNKREAFKAIQNMADIQDASNLTIELLSDAGTTGSLDLNLFYYKVVIASAETIPTLDSLQNIVEVANTWLEIEKAATTNDASKLTTVKLIKVGMEDVIAGNLSFYKLFITAADTIETSEQLQLIVNQANALAEINTMAIGADTKDLTIDLLTLAGATGTSADDLNAYKIYVAAAGTIGNLVDLQALIGKAGYFSQINKMSTNGDASSLTTDMLTNAGVLRVQAGKLAKYKTAIAAKGGIATLAALQLIIDTINNESDSIANISETNISIYPVPVANQLFIEGAHNRIRIISLNGQILLDVKENSNKSSFDVSNLRSGLYMLEVTRNSSVVNYKLIKK
jgi:hypothetical protein